VEVETLYVEPGSPWENGYAESFHGRFRDAFLSLEVFETLPATRLLTQIWRKDYNTCRPHSSLGYRTPSDFASAQARQKGAAPSTIAVASAWEEGEDRRDGDGGRGSAQGYLLMFAWPLNGWPWPNCLESRAPVGRPGFISHARVNRNGNS